MATRKKVAPKRANKKTASKKTASKKVAPKRRPVPAEKKREFHLRQPQVRVLAYLAKVKTPQNRKAIAAGAPVDLACCTSYIGHRSPELGARRETETGIRGLLTFGFVEEVPTPGRGAAYRITPAGRKALAAAKGTASKKSAPKRKSA